MKGIEFANEMSSILYGYNEAKYSEMLTRVKQLVELEQKIKLTSSGEKFVGVLFELGAILDSIRDEPLQVGEE